MYKEWFKGKLEINFHLNFNLIDEVTIDLNLLHLELIQSNSLINKRINGQFIN